MEEEEEDEWLSSLDKPSTGVTLLNPQVVHFKVRPGGETNGFSKIAGKDSSGEEDECRLPFEGGRMDGVTYDDLHYHPAEDELNSLWMQRVTTKEGTAPSSKKKDQFFQLSCAHCLSAVSYCG
jgi:hypothetical protein